MKIVDCMEQRVVIRFTPTPCVETDTTIGHADLATPQSMRPGVVDRVGLTEQMDGTGLLAATEEEARPVQRRVQIERNALWNRASRRRAVTAVRCFVSVCGAGGRRSALKRGDRATGMTLPALARPPGITACEGGLQSRRARWRNHGYAAQRQTQTTDAPDGGGKRVRPLQYRGVIHLGLGRQSTGLPPCAQRLHRGRGATRSHHPRIGERAVPAAAGEHTEQRAVGHLQVFKEVAAVPRSLAARQVRQIPALGRCRPAGPLHRIKPTATRQPAVEGRPRDGLWTRRLSTQGGGDRMGTVLAHHTVCTPWSPGAQDSRLNARRCSIPRTSGLAACEAHALHALAARLLHPATDRAYAPFKAPGSTAQRFTVAHRLHPRKAARFNGACLAMNTLPKMTHTSPNRSGNAETQVFG